MKTDNLPPAKRVAPLPTVSVKGRKNSRLVWWLPLAALLAALYARAGDSLTQAPKASQNATSQQSEPDYERLASAIYRIEGGDRTRYPYGIKSVKTTDPRRICINTCRNQWARWVKSGRQGDYYDSLADRYCPPSADPSGNRNWKRNVKLIMGSKHEQNR